MYQKCGSIESMVYWCAKSALFEKEKHGGFYCEVRIEVLMMDFIKKINDGNLGEKQLNVKLTRGSKSACLDK